jgi:hypothetical protein
MTEDSRGEFTMYRETAPGGVASADPAAAPAACWCGGEPKVADLLRDPITRALMAADHVERCEMRTLLASARGRLARAA